MKVEPRARHFFCPDSAAMRAEAAVVFRDSRDLTSQLAAQNTVPAGFGEGSRFCSRKFFPPGGTPQLYGRRDARRYDGNVWAMPTPGVGADALP